MYEPVNGVAPGAAARARKERKVSVLFRRAEVDQHCAGVNAIELSPDGTHLFSASRDSTIKQWDASPEPGCTPRCIESFEGHIDWVNDIVVSGDLLATCSNDKTVRLWQYGFDAEGDGAPEAASTSYSLGHHSDYVIALAAAPHRNLLASGGLRAEVFLWDVQQAMQLSGKGGLYAPREAVGHKESVYALAMNDEGTLLAAGSTESVIRITDPRTGAKAMKLKGHTGNVRSLLLKSDGSLLLSGSSDHTLRLWDLGQQRCIQTLAVHTDSVWALLASPDFSVVYSAGRDCCVYRTQLSTRTSELLFAERAPITDMAMSPDGRAMWVATPASALHRWPLDPVLPAPVPLSVLSPRSSGSGALSQLRPSGGSGAAAAAAAQTFLANPSPMVRLRQSFDGGSMRPYPQQRQPDATISGIPAIVQCSVLTDRQHILSRDSEGMVALWDVTSGQIVEQYGKVDFEEKERELFRPMSIPAWFSYDCKLGSLALHMQPPSAFLAEIYACDLGWDNVPDDLKLNFGEHMLKGLFAQWSAAIAAARGEEPPDRGCFQYAGHPSPAVMSALLDGRPWRFLANEFDGREREGEVVPTWVADAVLRSQFPMSKELKTAFVLQPFEGSGLPSMLQSRLNAPRILRIHKVASYTVAKLADQGVQLCVQPVYWHGGGESPRGGQPPTDALPMEDGEGEGLAGPLPSIEILCNNVAVPHDLSLSSVKAFIWRRSDDLLLQYRIRDPENPAPLPTIKPPK